MIPYAQNTVREAIGLLRTDESRFIAEHHDALDDAIRVLSRIDWG